jgi:LL-diaminopimelate aminotransferase
VCDSPTSLKLLIVIYDRRFPLPAPAKRLDQLPPYIFVSIAEKISALTQAGHTVIRLDIGNPDMPPPNHVVSQLSESANNPAKHGYSGYRGTATFRQAVSDHYARRFGVELNPETEVLPLIGSKEGIVNLSTAYLDPDDVVLLPAVGYPAYEMAARLAGACPVWVPMLPDENYMLDLSQVSNADATKAKLLWVNSPNNPTGGVLEQSQYAALVAYCREHDILLASDNPYVEVTYDETQAGSVLAIDGAKETSVEFMSFSKSYNMAGWRLGAAVGNADALQSLLHIKSNMDSGHFKGIYDAGIAAMSDTPQNWIHERNAIYQQRRDRILSGLAAIGLEAPHPPRGAMYIWARLVSDNPIPSAANYVEHALQEAHVSLAPGGAYGPGGADCIRISVGVQDTLIEQAFERLTTWYATRR